MGVAWLPAKPLTLFAFSPQREFREKKVHVKGVLARVRRGLEMAERFWVLRKLRIHAEESMARDHFVEGVIQTLLVVRWTKSFHNWKEWSFLSGYCREGMRLAEEEWRQGRRWHGLQTLRNWAVHPRSYSPEAYFWSQLPTLQVHRYVQTRHKIVDAIRKGI